jgi:hypothetical protein
MGEGCITAIESRNVLYDEGLIENSAAQGARLIARLKSSSAVPAADQGGSRPAG